MNTHITSILPAKKKERYYHGDSILGFEYNECVDDCAGAISRANLVVCPSHEDIKQAIFEGVAKWRNSDKHAIGIFQEEYIAKALLALLNENKICPADKKGK